MRNNYRQDDRTARLQKTKAGYSVEHTEHNGIMVYSRWFGDRKAAETFAKNWVTKKESEA